MKGQGAGGRTRRLGRRARARAAASPASSRPTGSESTAGRCPLTGHQRAGQGGTRSKSGASCVHQPDSELVGDERQSVTDEGRALEPEDGRQEIAGHRREQDALPAEAVCESTNRGRDEELAEAGRFDRGGLTGQLGLSKLPSNEMGRRQCELDDGRTRRPSLGNRRAGRRPTSWPRRQPRAGRPLPGRRARRTTRGAGRGRRAGR